MDKENRKQHDEWNHFKKILDSINIDVPFFDGEIWSIAIGTNIDIEINGKGQNFERPVIIIKKFSKRHAWIIPLSRVENIKNGIHVPVYHKKLYLHSVAMITQLQRTSNSRFLYKIGILDENQLLKIKKVIINHLNTK